MRYLFCNIPAYPNSLYLISAPFSLTLIKSGFTAYQVLACACVSPPQERKLVFKLISLSLGSSVLISQGVQKYLFNWIKRFTFSQESGAARRKSNKHNFKRTEHKNPVMVIRTVPDVQVSTQSYNRKPLRLHWECGLAFRIKMVTPFTRDSDDLGNDRLLPIRLEGCSERGVTGMCLMFKRGRGRGGNLPRCWAAVF